MMEKPENPLAVILKQSNGPSALSENCFDYFQALFASRPNRDWRRLNLMSVDWPASVLHNRILTGAAFTGVLLAMLDRQTHTGTSVTPELEHRLDEVIIEQAATTGDPLIASDLVLSRVCEWRLRDHAKYRRWQKALDKAFRIDQQRMKAPLDNPLLAEAKSVAVPELRLLTSRMKERFARRRRLPSEQEILNALSEEAGSPDLSFFASPHNRERLVAFYRRDPVGCLHLSPEKFFDELSGFVTDHRPDYMRRKISRMK